MKSIFSFIMLPIFFGCFNRQPVMLTGLEGKVMPSLNILLTDSATKLNINSISTRDPIVLFYFSPYCTYCRAQTKEMIENIESIRNIKVFMLSNFSLNLIRDFYKTNKLYKYPNITVGQDYVLDFNKYFHADGVPFIAIYGKDKRLKQVLLGKSGLKEIKDIALK